METNALFLQLFQFSLAAFVAGGVLPLVCGKKQAAANFAGAAGLFAGGGLLAAIAARLLLWGEEMHVCGWQIMQGIPLKIHFDALSAFFLLVVGTMAAVCAIYAYGANKKYYEKNTAGYLAALLNLFALSLVGVVGVDSSITFMIFWEFMAVSSFFLVMFEHEKPKVRSGGYLYLVMTHVCGAALSVAFLLLYLYTGSLEFEAYKNVGAILPDGVKSLIFFCFFIGFGAKMGLFPINVWLPRAYPVAPSGATALMSSAMIKTAVYAFIRVSFDFLGTGPAWWGIVIMAAGALSAVVGIMLGVIQNDTKRFLAYSSVENMGIICTGVGAALYLDAANLNMLGALALTAALYHVLSHSVFKSLMFMGAGAVQAAAGTCSVSTLGGLIRRMPFTAGAFLVGGMSLASLPPFAGFMSEWALLQTLLHMVFDTNSALVKFFAALVLPLIAFSGAVAAVAIVKHFGTAFLGKARSTEAAEAVEVNFSMKLGMLLLMALSLCLGVLPGGAAELIGRVVNRYFASAITGDFILFVPFNSGGVQAVSPAAAGLLAASLIILTAAFIYMRYGKSRYELQDVWTCGSIHTTAMQYTATSYSHPLLRIFQSVFGLKQSVKVEGEYEYYPKKISHEIDIAARVGDNVYKPSIGIMVEAFKKIRRVQNGNLQWYLSYIVAALAITLLCAGRW